MDDIKFKEGFLCPICVKDLRTIAELTAHFDTAHSAEDTDVLQSLKGFIGRAKRKLLKEKDGAKGDDDELGATSERLARLNWEPQGLGVTQTHTEHFREIRSHRVDLYVSQTNKLLLRLKKLITNAPSDPEKRKEHEKSLVPWVEDGDVRLCPGCAKSFNLSRRRHHCRLCGGIMCQLCSQFMEFALARKLINLTGGSPMLVPQEKTRSPLARRGSISSLASVMSPAGDPHLRLCRDCLALLNRRDRQIEQKMSHPIVVEMYKTMKGFMDEAEGLIPEYCRMVDSLQEGQSDYTLEEVQSLRVKLTKIAENVDLISRKIGILGTQDGGADGSGPSPRALQLQGCVRLAASHFLRQNMLGLPAPPSKEELVRLQGARREQLQQRIQREKAAAVEAQQRQSNHAPPSIQKLPLKPTHTADRSTSPSTSTPVTDSGWSPANVVSARQGSTASAAEDPMVQQMNIIRGYIQQARAARRMDEVAMLEANLKELKQEYLRMTMKET
ncbi:rabenosyn-5-like isoform X1 [Ornithodoros turicata]|uniref:rabenosyn-5-like isoform X1 n=1 Tax=Ornithodoros turicata TaxID=34597 RepID=UPI003138CAE4